MFVLVAPGTGSVFGPYWTKKEAEAARKSRFSKHFTITAIRDGDPDIATDPPVFTNYEVVVAALRSHVAAPSL